MRRRQFISLVGGAALAPLVASRGYAGAADAFGVPAARDDGWPVVSLDEARPIDRDALRRMADRLSANADVHAVVVARGGRLMFEWYFRGNDEVPGRFFGHRVQNVTFDADTLHTLKSASKGVMSLAMGIAIDRGLIPGVNEPIFNFFPELSDLRSPKKDRIRLVDALNMSMGLKWVEATPATGDYANDEARMHIAWDPCRYVLGLPVTAPAGEEFFYNTGALALIAAILRKATRRPFDEFVRETLFEPLGITHVAWDRYWAEADAGGGLHLRPRDMAKIGQLILAGGYWNDRQVVSKAWIETSTSPKLKATDDQFYGYLWWFGRTPVNGREVAWIGALGRGGQSIRIVPELDLVVAVTAGYFQDYSPRAFQTQFGVFKDVLRAISPHA
ncbi:MAG TPA: serine hydrolase [Bradyrhizobium sp.]|nr:serine hydrolase [Bradyrhizobium sp.]